MEQNKETPKVGIGSLVIKNGFVLIGRRLSGHGSGTWMIPGGHLELGETFEEAAMREAKEETGLEDLEVVKIISLSNDIEYNKHYISIGVLLDWKSGDPYNAEPDKSCDWFWCDPKSLPENMFIHSRRIIENWLNDNFYTKN